MEREYTYDDGFEDGTNTKESDILELLDNLLENDSLDKNTIHFVKEKVNEL